MEDQYASAQRGQVEPPKPFDVRSFALVGLILAIGQSSFYLMSAALPLVLKNAGAAQGRIGFEVGLGSLMAFAVTLLVGPVINRRGPELLLRIGCLAYVVSPLGMLAFPSELAITVFRVVQGIGVAVMPSSFVLAYRLLPSRPGTAIGVLGSVNSAALAAGPPIGLALYTQTGKASLFLPAAALAGLALFVTLLLPNPQSPSSEARGFGFDKAWLPLIASNVLVVMNFGGILAYLPIILSRLHGPNAGIFFTADALGVLALRIPTGIVADRYGSVVPKVLGILLTVPGLAVLALSPSILVLIAAGALTGTGAALFLTGVLADLARLSNDANRGTAMSMATASFSASIFVGSTISGVLIGSGGWDSILLFGALTTLGAFIFVFPAKRTGIPFLKGAADRQRVG